MKNVMCLINVCIKMENPGSFTFNYAVAFFSLPIISHIECLSICIPIENYDQFFYASMPFNIE